MKASNRQQGVAIITALLIVALAASTAAFMAWQQNLWLRQVENLQDMVRAKSAALGGIDWARDLLSSDLRNNEVDHLGEDWARDVGAIPVEEGMIGGRIVDQQGLFNLNNLVLNGRASEPDVERFRRLLALLNLPQDLANAVADWVDADNEARYPGGAEDMDYLSREPASRAANQMLTEVADLYRVQSFDAATIERLGPFVTALPRRTDVNVNTAPAEVLAALIPELALHEAAQLVEARRSAYFKDRNDFARRLPEHIKQFPREEVNVRSQYFLVQSQPRFGRVRTGFQALLERDGAQWPRVVWRKDL